VDNDWYTLFTGHVELFDKDFALHVSRRMIVMIIKPDLAQRNDARAVAD